MRLLCLQGFTQLHFTPLETLAIIEGVQKRVGKTFSREEIESGVLEDILVEEDYNLDRVVSFTFERVCLQSLIYVTFERLSIRDRLDLLDLYIWLFLANRTSSGEEEGAF